MRLLARLPAIWESRCPKHAVKICLQGSRPSAKPSPNFNVLRQNRVVWASCGTGACFVERVKVSEPASISSGIAERYATAIFELSRDGDSLESLERNLLDLDRALADSADLRELIASPVIARDDQRNAISAVARKMGLVAELANGLALMAEKRRLFVLPHLLSRLQDMIADCKGELAAEVTSAATLTGEQKNRLAETLKGRMGKDIKLNATVDESLIGGLIVKVGSKMIDTSIRSRLNSLQIAMKEVG